MNIQNLLAGARPASPVLFVGELEGLGVCKAFDEGGAFRWMRRGQDCRSSFRGMNVSGVAVLPRCLDVSALNLVSALSCDIKQDQEGCAVVAVCEGKPSGSWTSRAAVAGADAIVSLEALGRMLGTCAKAATPRRRSSGAAKGVRVAGLEVSSEPFVIPRHSRGALNPLVPDDLPSIEGGLKIDPPDGERAGDRRPVAADAAPDRPRLAKDPSDRGRIYPLADARRSSSRAGERSSNAESAGKGAPLISFVSGAGGVGKTTLCVLSAVALSKLGLSVCIADFDLQFGVLSHLFSKTELPRLSSLRSDTGDVGAIARQAESCKESVLDKVSVFAAPPRPEDADDMAAGSGLVLGALRRVFDVVLVDTGAYWSEVNASVLANSTRTLVVCDQRSSSLASAGAAADLCARLGMPGAYQRALLNRCDKQAPIDDISARMRLGEMEVLPISEGGREVDDLLGLGCPQDLFSLKNPCALSLNKAVSSLVSELGLRCNPCSEPISIAPQRKARHLFKRSARA